MNTRILAACRKTLPWGPQPVRRVIGAAIALLGAMALASTLLDEFARTSALVRSAITGGLFAAAATAAGTLPVLFSQSCSRRTYDCFLGFGAGVMLAATAFSLIAPAIAAARVGAGDPFRASGMVGLGIGCGALFMLLLQRAVSDNADVLAEAVGGPAALKRAWLFVAAVSLHNVPEGLAIGAAYAGNDLDKAHALAAGIAIQDVPEGLVVAMALRAVGYRRLPAMTWGMLSGLAEPVAAGCGALLIGMSANLLPIGLAGAAGAMLFVIVNDVIPESHRNHNGRSASTALLAGFMLMTFLDTAIG